MRQSDASRAKFSAELCRRNPHDEPELDVTKTKRKKSDRREHSRPFAQSRPSPRASGSFSCDMMSHVKVGGPPRWPWNLGTALPT